MVVFLRDFLTFAKIWIHKFINAECQKQVNLNKNHFLQICMGWSNKMSWHVFDILDFGQLTWPSRFGRWSWAERVVITYHNLARIWKWKWTQMTKTSHGNSNFQEKIITKQVKDPFDIGHFKINVFEKWVTLKSITSKKGQTIIHHFERCANSKKGHFTFVTLNYGFFGNRSLRK